MFSLKYSIINKQQHEQCPATNPAIIEAHKFHLRKHMPWFETEGASLLVNSKI